MVNDIQGGMGTFNQSQNFICASKPAVRATIFGPFRVATPLQFNPKVLLPRHLQPLCSGAGVSGGRAGSSGADCGCHLSLPGPPVVMSGISCRLSARLAAAAGVDDLAAAAAEAVCAAPVCEP